MIAEKNETIPKIWINYLILNFKSQINFCLIDFSLKIAYFFSFLKYLHKQMKIWSIQFKIFQTRWAKTNSYLQICSVKNTLFSPLRLVIFWNSCNRYMFMRNFISYSEYFNIISLFSFLINHNVYKFFFFIKYLILINSSQEFK